MRRGEGGQGCAVCGDVAHAGERRVLVRGRQRTWFCSQACLRVGVRMVQIARRKAWLRLIGAVLAIAVGFAGAFYGRHALRMWRARHAPHAPTAAAPPMAAPALPEPEPFGPRWPPTDEEWRAEFAKAAWLHPLPGPARRATSSVGEVIVADPAARARARCRTAGRCAVDLGGQLWGEHVYAALDGVVDRVVRAEDAPGGVAVRIAHWGGAVFTQYEHLAAVPTRLSPGARVVAGDVVGLVGDTGLGGDARARLRFSLSVWPASSLPEVYWDPEPMMAQWKLQTPGRGSVAGLVAPEAAPERIAAALPDHRRPILPPAVKKKRARATSD